MLVHNFILFFPIFIFLNWWLNLDMVMIKRYAKRSNAFLLKFVIFNNKRCLLQQVETLLMNLLYGIFHKMYLIYKVWTYIKYISSVKILNECCNKDESTPYIVAKMFIAYLCWSGKWQEKWKQAVQVLYSHFRTWISWI